MSSSSLPPSHFAGKDAVGHVVENQARSVISRAENHAHEIPGHLSALADAGRETALLLAMLWSIFYQMQIPLSVVWLASIILSLSWLVWKTGRSAWLGWSRLERLHRVIEEEKWEIENHRKQERDELRALYITKGFEGKLLEDVLDVLMADGDRLLRVMVEEELGLTLQQTEHPLKQALGACLGCLFAILLCLGGAALGGYFGILIATSCAIGATAVLATYYEDNRLIPAIVWNLGLAALPLACVHFLTIFALNDL